jgi:predicted nucleotide-binding protein
MESRSTKFADVRFSVRTLKAAIAEMRKTALENEQTYIYGGPDGEPIEVDASGLLELGDMRVLEGPTERGFSDFDLFLSELRNRKYRQASFSLGMGDHVYFSSRSWMRVAIHEFESVVTIEHTNRAGIDRVFGVFEDSPEATEAALARERAPQVFIGHGGNSAEWRDVRDHLSSRANLQTVEFGSRSRTGLNVVNVLREMLTGSTIAVLVLSGEDEQKDGSFRARENVVHEIGYFQSHLGNERTILLLERGVKPFSNLDGVQYIEYEKGQIASTFGEIVSVISREFPLAVRPHA